MQKSNVICFIPARSGSTRIKNKNIRLFNQRPLVYWTVLQAIKSKKFDKIIFSSDSKKYYNKLINYLRKDKLNYENLIFDKRENAHSKTKAKIFDYIKHDLIQKFGLKNDDLLVQMLPTCPLRSIKSIKKAINFSIINKKNCFSACEYDFHLKFGFFLEDHAWYPVFRKSPMLTGNTQSQSQKKFYHPNGAFNCLFIKSLDKKTKSIYHKASPIIISKSESFDLDTEEDLKILKKLFS